MEKMFDYHVWTFKFMFEIHHKNIKKKNKNVSVLMMLIQWLLGL